MNVFTSILMGILQGLTEFLPVSSSGHLVLAQHFLGIGGEGDPVFEIFLHLGTLVAVLVYFRRMLFDIAVSLFSWGNTLEKQTHRRNRTLAVYLLTATLATGFVYYIAGDVFESIYAKPLVVAFMLMITGALVFTSDFMRKGSIPASQMGAIRSVIIGFVQAVAIIPGISRSGSTISAALFTGIKRNEAAQFSFLLSIPAILAANLSVVDQLAGLSFKVMAVYMFGFASAFVVAYLVISILLNLIQGAKLKYFAYYCWFIALLSIILILWS
jgi:undecaprenyl-diphosphatase